MTINEIQTTEAENTILCKQQKLEVLSTFEYLASIITNVGKLDKEITKGKIKEEEERRKKKKFLWFLRCVLKFTNFPSFPG